MKSFAAILALAGAVAAVPAATTTASNPDKTPTASAPAGCSTNYDGTFEISVVNASTVAKRSLHRRTALVATLKDGILTDAEGRTGEIVANSQFQFDPVIQAGAIYTAGWSICENGTLALGGSAVFYECLSGTFYNLYDASTGAQCTPIFIDIVGTGSSVSQASDGQATAASQISDGQIQATTATAVVSQITDGQIQATTGVQVISQISDGQIQATTATAAVVSQISDGQIQATTATSAVVVSQISDGQIQATTATSAVVVSQISDGQIQATTATAAVVSQISDGQIQATSAGTISATGARNATTPTVAAISATVSAYTGAAAQATAGLFGLAAGAVALAFL